MMIMGHVDGNGNILDQDYLPTGRNILSEEGELVLEKNEELISKEELDCGIDTKWSNFMTTSIYEGGKGILYMTSKRLVFIRKPSLWRSFSQLNPFTAPSVIPEMAKQRDTYKYQFKIGRKVVHHGITNDLERREQEHQTTHDGRGHIKQVGRKTTEEAAREWEEDMGAS